MNKDFIKLKELFETKKNIHFIGIGGVSMSGLANYLLHKGYNVTGSDKFNNDYCKKLTNAGAKIFIGHDKRNIENADVVIYTAAVRNGNIELETAQKKGIPSFERAVLLGYLMTNYKYSVGVSGTHGKTTTTSLITCGFLKSGADPTSFIGGSIHNIGGNYRIGGGNVNVFEACEFVDSFLNFYPNIAVILNVEEDHLDYFKNIENIKKSFRKYLENTGDNGYAVVCASNKNAMECTAEYKGTPILFSADEKTPYMDMIPNCTHYYAKDITLDENSFPTFKAYKDGEFICEITLSVPGKHNVENALAAMAVCDIIGLDRDSFSKGLADYTGAGRRFELVGYGKSGYKIYDDYAHHPSEITTMMEVVNKVKCNKFYVVVQPHTYTRTKLLFNEFIECLSKIDNLILTKICAAREEDIYNISTLDLLKHLPNAIYCPEFEDVKKYADGHLTKDDNIITMGCGDIYIAARMMAGKI